MSYPASYPVTSPTSTFANSPGSYVTGPGGFVGQPYATGASYGGAYAGSVPAYSAPGYTVQTTSVGPRSPVLLGAPAVREVGYVSPPAVMQTAPTYVNTYRAPVQQMQYAQTSNMREIDEVRTYARHVPEAISYENQFVSPHIIEDFQPEQEPVLAATRQRVQRSAPPPRSPSPEPEEEIVFAKKEPRREIGRAHV